MSMDELQVGAGTPEPEVSSHPTIAVLEATTRQDLPTGEGADVHESLSYDLTCLRQNIDNKIPEQLRVLITMAAEVKLALQGYAKDHDVDVAEVLRDVENDLATRIAMGERKYGSRLKTNNGRNMMLDLYQELLDAVEYMKGCQLERLL